MLIATLRLKSQSTELFAHSWRLLTSSEMPIPCPGFELESQSPLPLTVDITPWATQYLVYCLFSYEKTMFTFWLFFLFIYYPRQKFIYLLPLAKIMKLTFLGDVLNWISMKWNKLFYSRFELRSLIPFPRMINVALSMPLYTETL